MIGLILLAVAVTVGGLVWCYRTREEDRMYQWAFWTTLLFFAGAIGVILEAFGIRF